MSGTDRLEAKGPRGEACIIVRTWNRPGASDGSFEQGLASYQLATGERLIVADPGDPATFETLDGLRKFTLR